MKNVVFQHAAMVPAMKRALRFEEELKKMGYYERVKFSNKVLGPNWIFRLEEINGKETIQENRPTWTEYYINDRDDRHLPLDPRAPQTDDFLTEEEGIRVFALYCGIGFDGYSHVVNTKRRVDHKEVSVRIGNLIFEQLDRDILEQKNVYNDDGNVPAKSRFRIQSEGHKSLFDGYSIVVDHFEELEYDEEPSDDITDLLEHLVVASLVAGCGAHRGCDSHATIDEANRVRLESIVTSLYISALAERDIRLDEARVTEDDWFC